MTRYDKITILALVGFSLLIVGLSILFAFLTGSGIVGVPIFLIAFTICGLLGFASGGRH